MIDDTGALRSGLAMRRENVNECLMSPSVCCCWGCHAPSIVLAFLDPAKDFVFCSDD